MADGVVALRQSADPDRLIDNEVVDVDGRQVYRQRVALGTLGGAATEATLGAVLEALEAVGRSGAAAAADWRYGQVVLAPGQTDVVVGYLAAADTYVRGVAVAADGDGVFTVEVDGYPVFTSRVDVMNKSRVLTVPLQLGDGQTIEIRVTGEGSGTSTYEGTILVG